jgi:hypothetical protein
VLESSDMNSGVREVLRIKIPNAIAKEEAETQYLIRS